VNEVRHQPDRGPGLGQQHIACDGPGEIADPGNRQFRPGRSLDRGSDRVGVDVGEHGSHPLADQALRDRATDAVSRAGDQRRLTRRVERLIQQAHGSALPGDEIRGRVALARATAGNGQPSS
jgi:hypothetical protein